MAQMPLQHRADSLKMAGDLEGAYRAYRALYDQAGRQAEHAYALAQVTALMYNPWVADSSFYFLKKALQHNTTVYALMDAELYFLTLDPRWEKIEAKQLARYEAHHGKIPHPEFAKALWAMIRRDQALRYFQRIGEQQMRQGEAAPAAHFPLSYFGVQLREQNLPELEKLIATYGWPKTSEFPGETANVAALIINHSDHTTRKRYLPLMEEALATGDIDPLRYAQIADRVLLDSGKRQLYGTQQRFRRDGSLWPEPIKKPEEVDQRRAAIGLGPLAPYLAQRFGIEWAP